MNQYAIEVFQTFSAIQAAFPVQLRVRNRNSPVCLGKARTNICADPAGSVCEAFDAVRRLKDLKNISDKFVN